jgi:ActR/RegA family two-component response regulator
MGPGSVLYVEDDPQLRSTLTTILENRGFLVTAVGSVPEALASISNLPFDILLSDLNIGEPGDGFTVVSAMRRVQPNASTFILTGYPDIETAVQGIRSQVDDYFLKPVNIDALLETLIAAPWKLHGPRTLPARKVSELLRTSKQLILARWLEAVESEPELTEIRLTKEERADHIPDMLDALVQQIESPEGGSLQREEGARNHGHTRRGQGYSIVQLVLEARILQQTLTSLVESNLLGTDFSTLVRDILVIGEFLNGALEISLRAYQSQVPVPLPASISALYQSPYLGLLIVGEDRVIDANDAFLRMIDHTRDQLASGVIDWPAMTPSMYYDVEQEAVAQLREFGTCAPYEKEFVRPDGSRLRVLIGAARLQPDPLRWAAYTLDLTEQKRAVAAEQKAKALEVKYQLVNRLAHEINNPLAAMTFTLHLLNTYADLPKSVQKLLEDTTDMLVRISASVSRILIENPPSAVKTSELVAS